MVMLVGGAIYEQIVCTFSTHLSRHAVAICVCGVAKYTSSLVARVMFAYIWEFSLYAQWIEFDRLV